MTAPWFEEVLTTRGTEIDQTATVGMVVFLRYFEHARWQLMREPALGLTELIHDGHFFVVRTQTVELRRRIGQGVRLAIRTRLGKAGRSTSEVLHEARRVDDDAIVARARVQGVWLGPSRSMVRLPEAFRELSRASEAHWTEAAGEPAERVAAHIVGALGGYPGSFTEPPEVVLGPLSLDVDAPRTLPGPPVYEHVIEVPPRDLDVFSHVNAATWLAYAHDARHAAVTRGLLDPAIAGAAHVARTAIFYAREACLGDRLRVALAPLDGALGDSHALGAWFFRDPEPEPLCALRVDLAPGARAVTAPSLRASDATDA